MHKAWQVYVRWAQAVSGGSGYHLPSPTKTLSPVDIPLQRKNQSSTIESPWVCKAHFGVGPWPAVDAPQSKLNGNFWKLSVSYLWSLFILRDLWLIYYGFWLCFYGFCFVSTPFGITNSNPWLLLEVFGDFTMICIGQFAICVSS